MSLCQRQRTTPSQQQHHPRAKARPEAPLEQAPPVASRLWLLSGGHWRVVVSVCQVCQVSQVSQCLSVSVSQCVKYVKYVKCVSVSVSQCVSPRRGQG